MLPYSYHTAASAAVFMCVFGLLCFVLGIEELQLSMTEIILQEWVNHLTPVKTSSLSSLTLPAGVVVPPIPSADDEVDFI